MATIHKSGETLAPLPAPYELTVTDPEDTGVRLFNLHDTESGITAVFVEFNSNFDVHAAIPWAGARTSRSDKSHADIYREVRDAHHAQKVEMFFGYGHASIADMSPGMIHINGLPMREAYWIFDHSALGGGQETSTRYIKLANPTVAPLEQLTDLGGIPDQDRLEFMAQWEAIQEKAHAGFRKWLPAIQDRLDVFVRRTRPDVKADAMAKRALDASRAWLPLGGRTSMSLQISVREAMNLITQLNQREDFFGKRLAHQLTTLYSLDRFQESSGIKADLAGLLKYTGGSDTIERNTEHVQALLADIPAYADLLEISESRMQKQPERQESQVELVTASEIPQAGMEVLAGYIMTIVPNIHFREALNFLGNISPQDLEKLAAAVLEGHTQHNVLRNAADMRGHVVEIDTALAYQRDFNRHRAMGRLATMLETRNASPVIRSGFNRSHVISNTDVLQEIEDEWDQDMADLYEDIYRFYESLKAALGDDVDYSFMYHALPLGHNSKLVMSGPLMQWNYLTHLRIRPGGDYGYRELTHRIIKSIGAQTLMRSFGNVLPEPDYNNVTELLDRS